MDYRNQAWVVLQDPSLDVRSPIDIDIARLTRCGRRYDVDRFNLPKWLPQMQKKLKEVHCIAFVFGGYSFEHALVRSIKVLWQAVKSRLHRRVVTTLGQAVQLTGRPLEPTTSISKYKVTESQASESYIQPALFPISSWILLKSSAVTYDRMSAPSSSLL